MVDIFDPPDFDGIKPETMSFFEYLNRSTGEVAARIRSATGEWLSRYPVSQRHGLITRIRSNDDVGHHAAYFELILHELLIRHDCRVEVEPQLGTKGRCPDFLVSPPKARRFVLEAVTASGAPKNTQGQRNHLDAIIDTINQILSPQYMLILEWEGLPDAEPPLKQLRQRLEVWLAASAPDDLDREFEWEFTGFSLKATARPRSKPGAQAIGAKMPEPQRVTAKEDIVKRVQDKAGAYGDLGMPFVIAVNSLDANAFSSDFFEALWGSNAHHERVLSDGNVDAVAAPLLDGVFCGERGPKWRRVSAVICAIGGMPRYVTQQQLMLIKHPHAYHPLRRFPLRAATPLPGDGYDRWRRAPSLAALLGLPADWMS